MEPEKEAILKLGNVFRPSAPIDRMNLFCGRTAQRGSVIDAINQAGQHVALYGERGVGKTSMASMLFPMIRAEGRPVLAPHVNCDSADDYASLWKKVFSELSFVSEKAQIGFTKSLRQEMHRVIDIVDDPITPDVVRNILAKLGDKILLIVILDEFDTLPSAQVRRLVADTIKTLSDHAVPATIVVVGVAENVEELIAEHLSIERCLAQIRMPRMSRDELESIITAGLNVLNMEIDAEALEEISGLSKGLPHYTHLLGLHSCQRAIDTPVDRINTGHVRSAMSSAIENAQHSIRSAYHRATLSMQKKAMYDRVILACAMADADDFGYFSPSAVRDELQQLMPNKENLLESFSKHLHKFCEADRSSILQKLGGQRKTKFRFANPLMQPFVLMKGLNDRLISEECLHLARKPPGCLF